MRTRTNGDSGDHTLVGVKWMQVLHHQSNLTRGKVPLPTNILCGANGNMVMSDEAILCLFRRRLPGKFQGSGVWVFSGHTLRRTRWSCVQIKIER